MQLERTPHLGELVWPGPNGQPLPASTFYKRWMAVRRRAGIRPVSFHALRHTAATLAIAGGQPLQAVARMLGHSVVTTTMKLYVHATDASAEALADFRPKRICCRRSSCLRTPTSTRDWLPASLRPGTTPGHA